MWKKFQVLDDTDDLKAKNTDSPKIIKDFRKCIRLFLDGKLCLRKGWLEKPTKTCPQNFQKKSSLKFLSSFLVSIE